MTSWNLKIWNNSEYAYKDMEFDILKGFLCGTLEMYS